MKKLILLFGIFFGLLVNGQDKLIINDHMAVIRDMGSFHGIDISGPFKVYFSVGSRHTVAVSASSEDARDRIQVRKSDGILKVELETSYKNWIPGNTSYKLYISAPSLETIKASGAVDFFVTDVLKAEDLKIQFTGASDFLGKLDCRDLDVHFTGASDIELTGTVDELKAVVTGASKLKASTLKVRNADIRVTGASNSTISVSNNLQAVASGASHIYYYGNPAHVDVSSTGASKVKKAN